MRCNGMVFSCLQNGGGEIGLVGGIREELRFQTETVARTVGAATLSKVPFRHLWLAKYSSGRVSFSSPGPFQWA